MNYLQFAFRNILRHRKRSIVTIMTVCLGFTALGVIGGMFNNIFSRLKAQAIVVEKLGHITFAKEGFFRNGKMEPEKYLWEKGEMDGILKVLRADPNVVIATPRLRMFGIASNGKASTIFITEATVPKDDQLLIHTPIDGRTENGSAISLNPDQAKRTQVAIGSELSSLLGINKGQFLTLMTSTKSGMVNALDVDVTDVYNTGNPSTNDKFVLTDFSLAQELYDTEGAERVVVTIKDPDNIQAVQAALLGKLTAAGHKIEAQSWEDQSMSYKKVTAMFGVIFRVLTAIITVIVLLTLLNTMQMAVAERTQEIGTMRAIGMLRRGVIQIFCIEGITMAIIGCMFAVPVLLVISNILRLANASFIPPVASVPVPLVLLLDPRRVVVVFVLFCLASLLSSFFVSRKISRQKVVDSLIHVN